jgi:OOP family OmpA-OmpF porin
MKKIHQLLAVTAAGLAFGSSAQAQAYLNLGAGLSRFDVDCSGTTHCDKSDQSLRLIGGFRIGASGLAAEGVVFNLGKTSARVGSVDVDLKAQAVGGGVALHADLGNQWSTAVRLGLASVKFKATGRLGSVSYSDSDNATGLYAGISGAYRFTPTTSLELAFESLRAKYQGDDGTIASITVGLGFRF